MISTVGTIVNRVADTAFLATLPNGKETIAFVEKKNAHLRPILQPGDTVSLTICPADLDKARIDGTAKC